MRTIATIAAAALALAFAAPALAQGQPGPEAAVQIAAIPGVVAGDAQWRTFWSGPMIVDGMTADADGNVLFAQEQSNAIIKVWPDGRWWVQWPFVAGAGAVFCGDSFGCHAHWSAPAGGLARRAAFCVPARWFLASASG